MTKIQKSIDLFQKQKEQFVEEIIKSDLPKLEKIRIFSEERLFLINAFTIEPFGKQLEEFKLQLKEDSVNINSVFNNYQRYQEINFYEFLFYSFDEDEDTDETLLTIFTCKDEEYNLPYKEVVDILYDFIITEKTIGFTYDW